MIEEPYELRPGDSFKTSCMYNNQDEKKVFGKGSQDEMCIHLIQYYPRRHVGTSPFICGPGMPMDNPVECEGTYTRVEENQVIQNSLDFVRPFGVPASVCHFLEEELEQLPQKEKIPELVDAPKATPQDSNASTPKAATTQTDEIAAATPKATTPHTDTTATDATPKATATENADATPKATDATPKATTTQSNATETDASTPKATTAQPEATAVDATPNKAATQTDATTASPPIA
jgi:Copper type II ascorbate-dependent monooxygenase, C-terminal domain